MIFDQSFTYYHLLPPVFTTPAPPVFTTPSVHPESRVDTPGRRPDIYSMQSVLAATGLFPECRGDTHECPVGHNPPHWKEPPQRKEPVLQGKRPPVLLRAVLQGKRPVLLRAVLQGKRPVVLQGKHPFLLQGKRPALQGKRLALQGLPRRGGGLQGKRPPGEPLEEVLLRCSGGNAPATSTDPGKESDDRSTILGRSQNDPT